MIYTLSNPSDSHNMRFHFHVDGDWVRVRYFNNDKESFKWRWGTKWINPDMRFTKKSARNLWKSMVSYGYVRVNRNDAKLAT